MKSSRTSKDFAGPVDPICYWSYKRYHQNCQVVFGAIGMNGLKNVIEKKTLDTMIRIVIGNSMATYLHVIYLLQPQHRIGVAIGDRVLDLGEVRHLFDGPILSDKWDVLQKVRRLDDFIEGEIFSHQKIKTYRKFS